MDRQSEKNLLNSITSSIRPHNMVNFVSLVWGTPPQQISTVSRFKFRYCSDVAERKPTKLCTMFDRLLGWYLCIHFRGLLPRNGIVPGVIFTLRPSLALSYFGSVTGRHSSSGRPLNFAALNRGATYIHHVAHLLVLFILHVRTPPIGEVASCRQR